MSKIVRLQTVKKKNPPSSIEELEDKVNKLATKVDELHNELESSRRIIKLLVLIISSQELS